MDAPRVKEMALELGADLVGIAATETLNRYPPDPKWPQTPDRINPFAKSAVVLAKQIPAGVFRAKSGAVVRYMDSLVIRRIDRLAHRLADRLEAAGHGAMVSVTNETDYTLKHGTYGYLSNRHLAIEAGLGTIGLNVNLVTPEYGSRVYVAAVLCELELEPDGPMSEQVCIGESCSRCLYACPADAVRHFNLDKRQCSTEAQVFGFAQLTAFAASGIGADSTRAVEMIGSREALGYWQALTHVIGCFGSCPRCLGVCPIGDDYHRHLGGHQKQIPEKSESKVALGREYRQARQSGDEVSGLNDWNIRWVGPEGYTGESAWQRRQAAKATEGQAEGEN